MTTTRKITTSLCALALGLWAGCSDVGVLRGPEPTSTPPHRDASAPDLHAPDLPPLPAVDSFVAPDTKAWPSKMVDPPPPCTGFKVPAQRDYTITMSHKGLTRTALVHIPTGYDATKPVPLVLNNHGASFLASVHASMTGMNAAADKRNMVVLHPQGTGGLMAGWNAGTSPWGGIYAKVDDVGFLAALVDQVAKTVCIDPKRVYCAGFSLGGCMCYRLSCDLSKRVAAFSSVAGPDATVTCKPKRPLPMLHIHGTADTMAHYHGDNKTNKGAPKSHADYAQRAGCVGGPVVTMVKGAVTCRTYTTCTGGATATLCTVAGGGHTWPGGLPWFWGGALNKDIDASAMVLDFFLKNPLK